MNPAAGGGAGPDPVIAAFEERGGHRVRRTAGPGDAEAFARDAADAGERRIVVAGGDGTLREVVQGLAAGRDGFEVTLGLVPLGTGNDFARSLALPDDPRAALDLALADGPGTIVGVDLMRVSLDGGTPTFAVNAVIVGQGGAVGDVLDPDVKERWGPLSYLRGAVEVAARLAPVRMAVTRPDGTCREASILNVVAANGRFAGHGVPVAPGARPDDGRLEVVVVDAIPLVRLAALLPHLVAGDDGMDPDDPAWHHHSGLEVGVAAVDPDTDLPVSIDGENTAARRVRVELEPGVLRFAVPGGAR